MNKEYLDSNFAKENNSKTPLVKEEHLKKKFIKDSGIPIPIVAEPYFTYFLHLFDPYFDSLVEFFRFSEKAASLDSEEYKNLFKEFFDNVVDSTKANEHYQEFLKDDFKKYGDMPFPNGFRKDIYSLNNSGKKFLSVDLKKANFNSLYDYNPKIFNNASSYEDWILSFENGDKFVDHKSIRQVIFGNLSPSRQQTLQKHFMLHLIQHLTVDGWFDISPIEVAQVYIMGSDEFLVDISHEKDPKSFAENLKEVIDKYLDSNNRKFQFSVETFLLEKIGERKELGFVRKFSDGKVDFKCVNKRLLPQAIKIFTNDEINELDLTFINEDGILSLMLEEVK